jgi:NAD(P)-dependent dehydrogenase (short-subunit alcohol dehydrogenase family)
MRKSVAILTEASHGIGRAIAIRLARDFEAAVLTVSRKKPASPAMVNRGRLRAGWRTWFPGKLVGLRALMFG